MYRPRALPSAAGVCAAAALVAGCGGQRAPGGEDAGARASQPAAPAKRELVPRLTGPRLVRMERIGAAAAGTHEIVTVGRDGSATIVEPSGGAGYMSESCRLPRAQLSALVRAVHELPLHGRIIRHPFRGTTMYVPRPTFIVEAGRHVESFSREAMPADAAPFVRHLDRIVTAREGRCEHTFLYRRH